MPPRDLRYHGSRGQRLLDEPRLVVGRELPASAALRDDLDQTNRGPGLKHMFKLRHKPISNQRSIIPRSTPSMEGGTETALTVRAFRAEKQEHWFAGLESAFTTFGGVPEEALMDNPRALVVRHDAVGRSVQLNDKLIAFAKH
ncbi:hypothetical protein ACT4MK_02645 [Bradyrhizobium barranii]|uniref:hypothetical protein n=1 Tax=Bradyrhizobium TaxID=374 RepID=UPI003F26D74A